METGLGSHSDPTLNELHSPSKGLQQLKGENAISQVTHENNVHEARNAQSERSAPWMLAILINHHDRSYY